MSGFVLESDNSSQQPLNDTQIICHSGSDRGALPQAPFLVTVTELLISIGPILVVDK